MTLYLKVLGIKEMTINEGRIYVDGSQAGTLVSPEFKSSTFKWDESFDINCSKNDKLVFEVCQIRMHNKIVKASGYFNSSYVIAKYGDNLNMNNSFEYSVGVYTEQDENAGQIQMLITYDRTQFYMGQLIGVKKKVSKDSYAPLARKESTIQSLFKAWSKKEELEPKTQQKKENIKKQKKNTSMTFYKGKCKSKNLFSMWDESADDQESVKIVERNYCL